MTDAPEKIWALADRRKHWQAESPQNGQHAWHWTEYTRKDIADAPNPHIKMLCDQIAKVSKERTDAQSRIAELEAALREVCQAVSWKEYGECRGWSDYLKTIPESLLQAKEALRDNTIEDLKGEETCTSAAVKTVRKNGVKD
jgi:hypothetical protein